jgi:hypothetical protein
MNTRELWPGQIIFTYFLERFMKKAIITLSLLAFGVTAAIAATSQVKVFKKQTPTQKKLQLAINKEMQQYLRTDGLIEKPVALNAAKASFTDAEVGDAGSFGRNVTFIGTVQTGVLTISQDCTPDPAFPPGPNDQCVIPDPVTRIASFNFPSMGKVLIPAKSVKTLICHWQTPFGVMAYGNDTGVYQGGARSSVTATYRIENEVLSDPALLDPNTGLPYGGSLEVALSSVRDSRGLQPGDSQVYRDTFTRVCNGGLLSKRALIDSYGLSEAQATKFFKKDTIINIGMTGSTRFVANGSMIIGTRFVGD